MKPIQFFILLISFLFFGGVLSGCETTKNMMTGLFGSANNEEKNVDPKIKAEQQASLEQADQKFISGAFAESEKSYNDFIARQPKSIFLARAQLGLARSLDQQSRWSESLPIYLELIERYRSKKPEIVAQSLFYVSSVYENLGREIEAWAAINESESLKSYLPKEKSTAELPARLASLAYRIGKKDEAAKYFKEAEKGFATLYSEDEEAPADKANIQMSSWYAMGSLSNRNVNPDNLKAYIETLQMLQIFLLRAIEKNGPWSDLSLQVLTKSYDAAWKVVIELQPQQGVDKLTASSELHQTQSRWMNVITESLQKLDQYAVVDENSSKTHQELKKYIDGMNLKSQRFLVSLPPESLPTLESQKRNELKREGQIVDHPEAELQRK